jgi:hypothetical protein
MAITIAERGGAVVTGDVQPAWTVAAVSRFRLPGRKRPSSLHEGAEFG